MSVVFSHNNTLERKNCLPDRFECDNGKCVFQDMVHDGKNDCGDNSDEDPNAMNCRNLPNSPYNPFSNQKKGSPGAIGVDGKMSKEICLNKAGFFPWWRACCEWTEGKCVPKRCRNALPNKRCRNALVGGKCSMKWWEKRCEATCRSCCGNIWDDKRCEKLLHRCKKDNEIKRKCRKSCKTC